MGFGDMDYSLYLLFRAIRAHSTVALSGESADEVFGGYLQFFDEEARQAEMFPWLVGFAKHFGDDADVLRADVSTALNLSAFLRESYTTAVADIQRLSGESDFEFRMRKICHLYLTRFVRILLDRKDRASMAVGLEVRVDQAVFPMDDVPLRLGHQRGPDDRTGRGDLPGRVRVGAP